MGSKTVSLKDEAYERLKRLKGDDKSFSEVVMELTEGKSNDFSDLIGADIDINWEAVKEGRKRTEADERREELLFRH